MRFDGDITLADAVKKVVDGEWIGKYETVKGVVELNDKGELPILSAGQNQNLWFDVTNENLEMLELAGIEVNSSYKGKSIFINTNDDMEFVSICNFRRYGWAVSPGRNAEYGYCDGVTFPNGDATFPQPGETSIFLRVELARTIGQMQKQHENLRQVLYSSTFAKAAEWLVIEAAKHPQHICTIGDRYISTEGMTMISNLK